VSAGNGTLARNTVTTDGDGRASTGAWVLGDVGANSLVASAANTGATAQTISANAIAPLLLACPFDPDHSGDVRATSDGLLLLRTSFDQSSGALTTAALATNATARDQDSIVTYVRHHTTQLDLDGNGSFDAIDAQIALRFMMGLRGDALTAGIRLQGTRTSAQIENYLVNACR
jgi:hypothetical protein